MTKMEKEYLKWSELRFALYVLSTLATIVISGIKLKEGIVDGIRQEFRAEIKSQINDLRSEIKLKEKEQDYNIEKMQLVLDNITNPKNINRIDR